MLADDAIANLAFDLSNFHKWYPYYLMGGQEINL